MRWEENWIHPVWEGSLVFRETFAMICENGRCEAGFLYQPDEVLRVMMEPVFMKKGKRRSTLMRFRESMRSISGNWKERGPLLQMYRGYSKFWK